MYSVISVVILGTFVILLVAEFGSTSQVKDYLPYCSFFNNRAPNVQTSLKNCTWFKQNSCCRQEEIDATFGRVKPLRGASPACQRYTNYLMCYICAPNQHLFYSRERLTVCVEFCDAWYSACRTAILKGSVIYDLYPTGRKFCESRRFQVGEVANGACYFFDARRDTSGTESQRGPSLCRNQWLASVCAVFVIWGLRRLV